ncbi:hypothetical protein [Proteiniclasticum ruminis]|uniref:Uncharacterized protein n=1 Tax=Proteiniclasticum ruminis TaxID=398199 RepID=A0A1I5EBD5_9CLOT|nr:hypothetical protein [Proteiniclasticum ruminis]SFO08633.1 hypothetical protein SAMN04488695_1158 [Proteiniclasticum ruminis]
MEMVLPRNYVEIEEEEMMYLDGGWTTVRGWLAANELNNILLSIGGWYKSAAALLVKTATYSVAGATVIGAAAAILSALGASGSLLGAALNLGALTLGIYLLAKDYGFQHRSWSIFGFGVHNVKPI